jgi:hypothetical protein
MEEEGRKDNSSDINDALGKNSQPFSFFGVTNLEEHSLESFESCSMIRISTAPSRPLTDLE